MWIRRPRHAIPIGRGCITIDNPKSIAGGSGYVIEGDDGELHLAEKGDPGAFFITDHKIFGLKGIPKYVSYHILC